MPYPSLLPGRAFRAPQPYSSRLLFDWAAADLSLTARTGQVGTFSAASAQRGLIVDVNGRPINAPPGMPRFGTFAGLTGLLFEPAKTQIVENADAEADAAGYTANVAAVVRDNTVAYAGQWAIKVTTTGVINEGVWVGTRAGTRMAAVAGTGYSFTMEVYAQGSAVGKSFTPRIEWWTLASGGALVSTLVGAAVVLVAGWQRIFVSGVAPATTTAAAPTFYTTSAQGVFSVWCDVPQFEAVQASSSPFYFTTPVPTLTASFVTVDEALTFPFPSVLQSLWAYVKYVDLGVGTGGGGGASGVFQLGNTFQGGWVLIDGGGGSIQGYYEPPGGTSTSQLAYAYAYNNIVEAVVQILADGSARTAVVVNGGNEGLGANGGVPSGGVLPFGNPGAQFNPTLLRFARTASAFQPFAMVRCKVGAGLLPGVGAAGAGLRVALARAA